MINMTRVGLAEIRREVKSSPKEVMEGAQVMVDVAAALTKKRDSLLAIYRKLDATWYGQARNAYAESSGDIDKRLKTLQFKIKKASQSMETVQAWLKLTPKYLDSLIEEFEKETPDLLKACQGIPAERAETFLESVRRRLNRYLDIATEHRANLQRVLAAGAKNLDYYLRNAERFSRCPFKMYTDLREMQIEHEKREPMVYRDRVGKSPRTVGIGFNLERGDGLDFLEGALRAQPDGITDFKTARQEIYDGTRALTDAQIEELYRRSVDDARQWIYGRYSAHAITEDGFKQLPVPIQAALTDIAFQNPGYLRQNPQVIHELVAGDYDKAGTIVEEWAKGRAAAGVRDRHLQNAQILRNLCQ